MLKAILAALVLTASVSAQSPTDLVTAIDALVVTSSDLDSLDIASARLKVVRDSVEISARAATSKAKVAAVRNDGQHLWIKNILGMSVKEDQKDGMWVRLVWPQDRVAPEHNALNRVALRLGETVYGGAIITQFPDRVRLPVNKAIDLMNWMQDNTATAP